jgi:hypothetical protein
VTQEERRRVLSAAELADARGQAQRALDTVGIPPELIDHLRPILAPAAEALADQATAHTTAA